MSGRGIGSLNVIVKYPDAGTNNTVWSLSGDQGDKWLQGQVPIVASTTYQVCFLGGKLRFTGIFLFGRDIGNRRAFFCVHDI